MKEWSDVGIVISSAKYGEKYKIVNVFTKNHGKIPGLISNAKNSRFLAFSKVDVNWSSRNRDLIGFWKLKNENQNWTYAVGFKGKMAIIQSVISLLNGALPIGVKHEELFEIVDMISCKIQILSERELLNIYAYLEFVLLEKVGFGFDFEICVECGKKEEFCYISPKTGRLVPGNCDSNAKNLFRIPKLWERWRKGEIFSQNFSIDLIDIHNSLEITLFFIRENIFNFDNFFRISLSEIS
ncbi:MAG: DNA repair protein RecO [Holosporales bacterium]|jgi:DNA repair protein RecO (recombination protein O)|nr:DNA repair protein RecO [Holosporales bacterium]